MRTGAERPATSSVPATGAGPAGGGAGAVRSQAITTKPHSQSVKRPDTLCRMALRDTLLAEYDHEMGTTRKLLERIPDDKLTWKPHERSMALGELATHLGNIPTWGVAILNDSVFDLASAPSNMTAKTTRADILAFFDDSSKRTRALMDKTDPEYMVPWTLRRGGQVMFTMPRMAAFRSFVLSHTIHHRGQL